MENLQDIYFNETLETMKIDEDITMKQIYDELEKKSPITKNTKFNLEINKKIISIEYGEDYFHLFYKNNKIFYNFQNPITIHIKEKNI